MAKPTILAASAAILLIICNITFTTAQDTKQKTLENFAAAVASGLSTAVTDAKASNVSASDSITATAWQADDPTPDAAPPPKPSNVDVSLHRGGLNVAVKNADGSNFRLGLGNGQRANSLVNKLSDVSGDMVNILMPWLPKHTTSEVAATSGNTVAASSSAGTVRSAVHQAVASQVADKINFATKQSDLIKETVNKQISDYISSVNSASNFIQSLIKHNGTLLKSAAGKLGQGVGGIQGVVAGIKADGKQAVQDKVNDLSGLSSQFTRLSSSMLGDMGTTAGLLTDAAASNAKAMKDIYTTQEGLVKAHIDATVQKRVDALNSLLDKIIAVANSVSTSGVTGPVIDWKLSTTQTKLQALQDALDRLAVAVKAMPTYSQMLHAELALLGSTRVGQAIKDPAAAMAQLLGKISQAKSAITSKIAAANMG